MLNFDEISYLYEKGFSLLYLPYRSKNPKGVEYIGWTTRDNYSLEELKMLYSAEKNLAVRLGAFSMVTPEECLVAVDFDVREKDVHGNITTKSQKQEIKQFLISLLNEPKLFPAVKSGSHSGSMHFYAKCPAELVPNDIQIFKAPWGEIVLKAQGSLIVLPPSTHPDSLKQYEWVRHIKDFPLPNIKDFPIWDEVNAYVKYENSKIERLILTDSIDLNELRLSETTKSLIRQGDLNNKYVSRSEAIYAAIHALINIGVSDDAITTILTNPEHALSEKPLQKGHGSLELASNWLSGQIYKAAKTQHEQVKQDFLEPLLENTEKKTGKLRNAVTFNFHTISTLEDIKHHPYSKWIMPGRFLEKQLTITAAPGGSGKSAYSLQEGMSIALNKNLGVGQIRRPGNVLIYNTEDDMDEIFRRVYALCKHFKIHPRELTGKLFLADTSDHKRLVLVSTDTSKNPKLEIENIKHLREQIVQNNIVLCVIDPLVKFHAINENDNPSMDKLASLFTLLAQQTNAAFNLIHHTKKPSGTVSSAGDADAIRGASALVNAARIAHTFTGMSKKDAEDLAIDIKQRKRFVRLDSAKQNLYLDLDEALWFEKVSVCLENDPHGIESDWRCAFVPWNEPAILVDGITVKMADEILEYIRHSQNNASHLVTNTGHPNYAIFKIEEKFNLSETHIKNVLNHWKNTGEVEIVEIDKHKRLKAYCVTGHELN